MTQSTTTHLALIGAGGQAQSLLEFARDQVAGYVDTNVNPRLGIERLGSDEEFLARCPEDQYSVHVTLVGGTGKSMALRRRIIERYRRYRHATLIAPTAIITPSSTVGEGSAVMHRAVINGATIGRYCIINTGAIVEHACSIADNVFVGPGATICGGVTIGADTFIGAGATVRNGVTICAGAVIGIGAAVTKDITAPGVYVGCPAKNIV